jgi:phasin
MSKRVVDLTAEELDGLALEAWSAAAEDALAKGLSVTGSHDGRLFRYHPDRTVDDLGPVNMKSVGLAGQELPRADRASAMPSELEAPAAFREIAEKRLLQARDNYEKMKLAAEEATNVLEVNYATASKGATDYNLKVIEMAREHTKATFDFADELLSAKTLSELVELSSAHARKQFEALSKQSKELAALAEKVAVEAAQPIREGMTKAAKKVN